MKRFLIVLIVLLSPVLFAQQSAPDPQVQALQNQVLKLVEQVDSLSTAAAQKTQQIKQLSDAINSTIIPACTAAVEKISDGKKTLDLATLTVKDKPQPEVAKK